MEKGAEAPFFCAAMARRGLGGPRPEWGPGRGDQVRRRALPRQEEHLLDELVAPRRRMALPDDCERLDDTCPIEVGAIGRRAWLLAP